MTLRQPLALLALGLMACGSGQSDGLRAGPEGVFEIDGRGISIHCWPGSGPTVLIDAGLGEDSSQWQGIAGELGGEVSVCTFDRPGYGNSDPGPYPRSPRANAEALNGLIGSASLEGPFILLGHSLGGLNAQAFWREYPDEVVGMILLDPPPRAWLEGSRFHGLLEMAVAAGEQLRANATQATGSASPEAQLLEAMASEHIAMMETGAAAANIEFFGDLPLLVVASGRPNPAFGDTAAAYQEFWVNENRRLANRSSRGRTEVLDSVGHGMNREAPAVLLSLIRGFLNTDFREG